ncbi:hypothetical protein IQ07DRAFT_117558 [Pyrenochaeta sp. DS3sAY3a]|nr:hypothetical protein IQ07DRAFT_117558 [Pyrenochaeta sp. DS3sAY3a]
MHSTMYSPFGSTGSGYDYCYSPCNEEYPYLDRFPSRNRGDPFGGSRDFQRSTYAPMYGLSSPYLRGGGSHSRPTDIGGGSPPKRGRGSRFCFFESPSFGSSSSARGSSSRFPGHSSSGRSGMGSSRSSAFDFESSPFYRGASTPFSRGNRFGSRFQNRDGDSFYDPSSTSSYSRSRTHGQGDARGSSYSGRGSNFFDRFFHDYDFDNAEDYEDFEDHGFIDPSWGHGGHAWPRY